MGDHATSVYELPRFRLIAAPRHVYSNRSATGDSSYKSCGPLPLGSVRFWPGQHPQSTGHARDAFSALQTQEFSHRIASGFLSSHALPPGRVAPAGCTTVTVKNSGHRIHPACSPAPGDRQVKGFLTATACSRASSPSCVDGPLIVPVRQHESARRQRCGRLTLQTNSFMIPSTTRGGVLQPKNNDKLRMTSSLAESACPAEDDSMQENEAQSDGTCNVTSTSSQAVSVSMPSEASSNECQNNSNNNSNAVLLSNPAALQQTDSLSLCPVSQQKMESNSVAPPLYTSCSKRPVSVKMLMENGNAKSCQFTVAVTPASPVGQTVDIATPENTNTEVISGSVAPKVETAQPESDAGNLSCHPVSHSYRITSGIKVEKRLIANTQMTICTLPVPRPALVCKPLKPSICYSKPVVRSYRETARSLQHDNVQLTDGDSGAEQQRSSTISRLPYVGADLWEMTTQRLQRATIDKDLVQLKESLGPRNERINTASVPKDDCTTGAVSNSTHPPGWETTSNLNASDVSTGDLQGAERSRSDVSRLVKKCLSAKTVRPRTELAVRASQSTSYLQQTCGDDDDESETVVDCDIELSTELDSINDDVLSEVDSDEDSDELRDCNNDQAEQMRKTPHKVHAQESSLSSLSFSGDCVQPALVPSLFPNHPPTINFVIEGQKVESLPEEYRRLLRWRMSPITPNVVKLCIARSGFRPTNKAHTWIGYWGKHMKAAGFKSIREYQKLGRKDRLWHNLSKLQLRFGRKEFGFFPQTYVLPADLTLLKNAWDDSSSHQKWIIKPPASARGIGIRVTNKWSEIPKRRPVIVQHYIASPYLINGSKFDLRIYVYITCYDPLRIYVYDNGLARFASVKYSSSTKSLHNRFIHLTNYSINKNNSDYQSNSNDACRQGHKWTLKSLWSYLHERNVNTVALWAEIKDMIVKTVLSSEAFISSAVKANVRRRYSCHELFGFDIILDDRLKPWVLEANISPSLHSNSQLDISVKGNMIRDLLNMAGYMLPDKDDVQPNPPTSVDTSVYKPPNRNCMDRRLWPSQKTADERAKHAYYCQKHSEVETILNILTPDDIRILIEFVGEDSRRGNFERIFPTTNSRKYHRYFEQPRYYNLLLDAWCRRYARVELQGVSLLRSYCAKGVHLRHSTSDPQHQWVSPGGWTVS